MDSSVQSHSPGSPHKEADSQCSRWTLTHIRGYACNACSLGRGDSCLVSDQDLSFVINRTEDNYSSDGQIGKGVGDPLFLKLYCNFSLRPRGIFSLSPNLRVYLFFP